MKKAKYSSRFCIKGNRKRPARVADCLRSLYFSAGGCRGSLWRWSPPGRCSCQPSSTHWASSSPSFPPPPHCLGSQSKPSGSWDAAAGRKVLSPGMVEKRHLHAQPPLRSSFCARCPFKSSCIQRPLKVFGLSIPPFGQRTLTNIPVRGWVQHREATKEKLLSKLCVSAPLEEEPHALTPRATLWLSIGQRNLESQTEAFSRTCMQAYSEGLFHFCVRKKKVSYTRLKPQPND